MLRVSFLNDVFGLVHDVKYLFSSKEGEIFVTSYGYVIYMLQLEGRIEDID